MKRRAFLGALLGAVAIGPLCRLLPAAPAVTHAQMLAAFPCAIPDVMFMNSPMLAYLRKHARIDALKAEYKGKVSFNPDWQANRATYFGKL